MSTAHFSEVLKYHAVDTGPPAVSDRIAHRRLLVPISIAEPDPNWPKQYERVEERILDAIRDVVISIAHYGSTSVPGLPAKPIIDVDLVVMDVEDEASYVSRLENAGFLFLFREPLWNQRRFFVHDREGMYPVNLHVWGPRCPEVERHRIYRDWLRKTPRDVELYARIKRQSATETVAEGGTLLEYSARKHAILEEILQRAMDDERER